MPQIPARSRRSNPPGPARRVLRRSDVCNAAAAAKIIPRPAPSIAAIPACPSYSALKKVKTPAFDRQCHQRDQGRRRRKCEQNPFGTSSINRHCCRHECDCCRRKISDKRDKSRAWIDANASGERMPKCCRRAFPNRMGEPNILQWHHLNQHPNCRNGCNDGHRANDARQKTSLAWTNSQGNHRDRHGCDCGDHTLDDWPIKDDVTGVARISKTRMSSVKNI